MEVQMHRQSGQIGFADSWLPEELGRNERLERIHACIDWIRIERLVSKLHGAPDGRKAYPPLVMVKVLLLQQWYQLSDPRVQEALADSLSFRVFAGLGMQDGTPDYSTVSRFRKALTDKGLGQALFDEIADQLDRQGLIVRKGTLLDATLIEAQAKKPAMSAGPGAGGPSDKDASWTKKNGKSHYGYKAHIAVDEGSGIIRRAIMTTAKVYESEVADQLICGDEKAVYADKAYELKQRRLRLKSMGVKDRIMHRSHKHQKCLPHWQERRNRLISPVRAAVERVFGTLKRSYNYRKVRYFCLAANTTQLLLTAIAYNLRKAAAA
jgi:IS5 family transposase